jgi:hypothetical protein
MTSLGTVSVLIPTYNRAPLLPATLVSVFNQTTPVDEVILVDDGSTDHTPDIVAELQARHPQWRLTYVRQENQGKSVALNRALEVARGDWFAFLDSDDRWRCDKLEWQWNALHAFPECGACITDAVWSHPRGAKDSEFAEHRRLYPEQVFAQNGSLGRIRDASMLFARSFAGVYMQSVLVRATVMRQLGTFDPALRVGQDLDFLFRLSLLTSFCYVDQPLLEVHRDPGRAVGLTTEYGPLSIPRLLAETARRRKSLVLLGRSRPELSKVIGHDVASLRSALANQYIRHGDARSARRILYDGLRETFELRLLVKWLLAICTPFLLRSWTTRALSNRPACGRVGGDP